MDNFSEIKKQMQRSEENLTSFACLSSDAIREKSEKEDIRLEFERDVDKIIHSSTLTGAQNARGLLKMIIYQEE
mgnify:CR=1 FL=1